MAVLRLGVYYDCDDAKVYGTQQLNMMSSWMFPSALRLHLARTCFIHKWVEVAVKQLLLPQRDPFTPSEVVLLSDHIDELNRARDEIKTRRLQMAMVIPTSRHGTVCQDRVGCIQAWSQAWWGEWDRPGVMYALLHPDKLMPGGLVLEKMQALTLKGMHPFCRMATLQLFDDTLSQRSPLRQEEDISDRVVKEILASLL